MKRHTKTPWLLLMLGAACSSEDGTGTPPVGSAGTTAFPTAGVGASGAGSAAPTAGTMMTPPVGGMAPTGTAGTGSLPRAGTAAPPAGMAGMPAAMGGMAGTAGMPMTGECEGFKLEGLLHSPGGNVLPNKCMPFHPTKNNPYAVRCVDAWPWYKTKFPGDDFCILPPPPDKGVQYGVHPQGIKWFDQVSKGDLSGYDNLTDAWLMMDGEEESANFETKATNPSSAKYYRSYARMRPGSHHMIINSDETKPADDRWYPVSEGGLVEGAAGLLGALSLPGAQRPDENRPPSLEKPMEDTGHYRDLPANAKITFNMHHFNASGQQIMKEAWTNLWWETETTVPVHGMRGLDIGQVLTMAIAPGSTVDLHYSWTITEPVRLVEAFGHRHAWTTNFSAWIEHPDGKNDIVYQSFEWLDEPTYRYDSVTMNPMPNPMAKTDGAKSGITTLMPGQKLHFNCHIEYTQARATSEKAPMPQEIGTLRFANEAFTGEMCILFGSTAKVQMPSPVADLSPLPDFATID